MTEEQVLAGHLTDLAKRAYDKNIYTYSGFLSITEQILVDSISRDFAVPYRLYGGYDLAERQIIEFGSPELFGYDGKFPISVIEISPLSEKYGEQLSHRDYLGSLMNLGISRDTIGDILIKEKNAYIFSLSDIAKHICDELTRVRHTSVCCTVVSDDIPALQPTIVAESYPVASLRIDVVVATVCRVSRKIATTHFERGEVILNGKPATKTSHQLGEGDVFSIRGRGKFRFVGTSGTSKRGKTYINIERYV